MSTLNRRRLLMAAAAGGLMAPDSARMTGSNQPASGRSWTAILASSCASGSQSDPPAPGELRERLGIAPFPPEWR